MERALGEIDESDLECSVCFLLLDHPTILSCSHYFCRRCLLQLASLPSSLCCPLCRAPFSLPLPPVSSPLSSLVQQHQQRQQQQQQQQQEQQRLVCFGLSRDEWSLILLHVFLSSSPPPSSSSSCSPHSLLQLATVCKVFHRATQHPTLWRLLCQKHFPFAQPKRDGWMACYKRAYLAKTWNFKSPKWRLQSLRFPFSSSSSPVSAICDVSMRWPLVSCCREDGSVHVWNASSRSGGGGGGGVPIVCEGKEGRKVESMTFKAPPPKWGSVVVTYNVKQDGKKIIHFGGNEQQQEQRGVDDDDDDKMMMIPSHFIGWCHPYPQHLKYHNQQLSYHVELESAATHVVAMMNEPKIVDVSSSSHVAIVNSNDTTTVIIMSLPLLNVVATIKTSPTSPINVIKFNYPRLLTGHEDACVRVWDVSKEYQPGQEHKPLYCLLAGTLRVRKDDPHHSRVKGIAALQADEGHIVAAFRSTVKVWSLLSPDDILELGDDDDDE